ncbi:hypothetical protein BAE44_0003972 [Dichanthelium oligosanthes]|uniref:Myb/SANT-like domain-containing protein n=1 Tax=Dichanthelium oligosanthes TaxID=888268 RepID=A0A1E5WC53_9POAL|nr:hypothetical protein BAE44_0003972 [Dichanthelium oligosanthes]
MMKEYHLSARYRGQNGWTKEGWNNMATRLNNKYPVSKFTVPQLKDREQRLKKEHNIVKSIVSKSGFGKVAEGKRCRRTTNVQSEKGNINSSSQEDSIQEYGIYFFMGSPDTTRTAAEFDFDLRCEDGINTNATDSPYGVPVGVPENSHNPSANQEHRTLENSAPSGMSHRTLENSAPSGMSHRARSGEKGPEKNRSNKNKDVVLESLVALRKEELESYKELKSKQIESYKEVKLA